MNILKRMEETTAGRTGSRGRSARPAQPAGGPSRSSVRRRAADAAMAGLGAAGLMHAAWAVGSTWPAATSDELADLVVGVRPFPSSAMTFGVVGLIGVGAGLVALEASRREREEANAVVEQLSPAGRLLRLGAWGVVGVLALRGGGGFIASALRLGQATDLFRYWDLRIYSPLCVGLAALSFLAIRPPSTETGDPAQTDAAQ